MNGCSMLLLFLLLRRALRALEGGPSKRQHLPGVGREDSEHVCSQCSTICGSSIHREYVWSTDRSNKWAYALSRGVCPDLKRARRMAAALFEVALQPAFSEKFSYTMAVWDLLGRG